MGLFLPLEVVSNILSRLPVKTLLRCKSVCKSWLRLISDTHFVAAHLEQSKKRPNILLLADKYHSDSDALLCYDEVQQRYIPSLRVERWHRLNPHHCDGLVLLSSEMNIFVCNPCTREHVCLHRSHLSEIHPGFGFDPWTSRYKVVRLFEASSTALQCEVFTLGSSDRTWRSVGCPLNCWIIYGREAATVDGVVYWLGGTPHEQEREQEQWQLLSFDLRDESFRFIQIPHLSEYDDCCRYFLINHEGDLCLIVLSRITSHKEVWVLSTHDNKWSKRYSFEFEEVRYYFLCPAPVILSGDRILFNSHDSHFCYDMRNRGLVTTSLNNDDARYFGLYAIHAESLASVGLGPVDEDLTTQEELVSVH